MKASATISALALFLVVGANAQTNGNNNIPNGFSASRYSASPAQHGVALAWSTACLVA